MKLKPIEPGCLAIILTNSHGLSGSEVKVIKVVPPHLIEESARDGVWWIVQSERISAVCVERKCGGIAVEEAYLMRIDGGDQTMDDLMAYDTPNDRTVYVKVRADKLKTHIFTGPIVFK